MTLTVLTRALTLSACLLPAAAQAQTASGGGGLIGGTFDGNWPGPGGPLALPDPTPAGPATVNVPVERIDCIAIEGLTHSWMGDVSCSLRDPDGIEYLIFVPPGFQQGGGGNDGNFQGGTYTLVDGLGQDFPTLENVDYQGGCFNVDFETGFAAWSDGDAGVRVSLLQDISGPAGEWTLVFYDWYTIADNGSFTGWSMSFNGQGTCDCPNDTVSLCAGDGGDQAGCSDCPCTNEAPVGTVGGCLNSSGTSARMLAGGSLSVSATAPRDLAFSATGLVPNSFAVLLTAASVAPQNPTHPCFGLESGLTSSVLDGLRCAVGATQRLGGRAVGADGTMGFSSPAWGGSFAPLVGLANLGNFVAGQTSVFQVFYRELPGTGCLTEQNTTQAVRFTWEP